MMGGNQKTRRGLGEIQSIVSIHAIYAQKNQKEFKPDLVAKVRGSISLFCHKKRLLSAMITDDSLDNFCTRAWVLGEWWVSLSLYPPYL